MCSSWQKYLKHLYEDECVAIVPFVANERMLCCINFIFFTHALNSKIQQVLVWDDSVRRRLGQRRKYIREMKHFKTNRGENTWTSNTLDVLRTCGVNVTSILDEEAHHQKK